LKYLKNSLLSIELFSCCSQSPQVFRVLRSESYALGSDWHYFEWNIGPVNSEVGAEKVAAAWTDFFKRIIEAPLRSARPDSEGTFKASEALTKPWGKS
jgi:hypothetical protein